MSGSRFAIFISLVLTVWGLMHWYVFWRLGTIPLVSAHMSIRRLTLVAAGLGLSYPLARMLNAWNLETPAGATILLSHSPLESSRAAAAGANLMLSGHTHAGQIWPFNFLVRIKYPFLAGLYQVAAMTLIVSRGAGTWGPPMRLWQPSDLLRIRLSSLQAVQTTMLPYGRL